MDTLPVRLSELFLTYSVPSCFHASTDLTKYGSHVYVIVRRDELRASKIMAKRLLNNPKIVCTLIDLYRIWLYTDLWASVYRPSSGTLSRLNARATAIS